MPQPSPGPLPLTVGIVYRGPKQDEGYNASHARGVAALAELPGVTIKERELAADEPPTADVYKGLVETDGASLIFDTGFDRFDPWLVKAARSFPNATFLSSGGLFREGLHPNNAGSFYGYLEEAHYVAGIAAAMTSRKKRLGIVASRPVSHVIRSVDAFALGARSVNPKIVTEVIFTGAWSNAARELAAVERLLADRVDVVAALVDAPRTVVVEAEHRGMFTVGVHGNQGDLAPKGFITGAEWEWSRFYREALAAVRDKSSFPKIRRGGFKDGFVTLSPFGPSVSAAARTRAEEAKLALTQDKLVIFRGPLKDNQGNLVLPTGRELIPMDSQLEQIQYLVEGVVQVTLR